MESKEQRTAHIEEVFSRYGAEILSSTGMQVSRLLPHHKTVTVWLHSVGVTYYSLKIARVLHLSVDERALVRGALLHDYFLYDWHDRERWHRFHGFRHPRLALENARRDFLLSPKERDIIRKHMFPLTPKPPRCRESAIVCVADKICAVMELMAHTYIPNELLQSLAQESERAGKAKIA